MQLPYMLNAINDFTEPDGCIHGEGFSSKYSTLELQNRRRSEAKSLTVESSIVGAAMGNEGTSRPHALIVVGEVAGGAASDDGRRTAFSGLALGGEAARRRLI